MTPRAAWVLSLLACEGTPVRHQGRLRGVGMDCPAPMILAAREHHLVAPDFDFTGYGQQPDGSLQTVLDAHLTRVDRTALQLGDVVLNAFRLQPPRHIAYIVGELHGDWQMLHADAMTGRVQIERLQYGRYYRYVQGYAVPGVA